MRVKEGGNAAVEVALAATDGQSPSGVGDGATGIEEEAPRAARRRGQTAREGESRARPTPGLEGPEGHGIAAGRIPSTERALALPSELVFVDRYGNETPTPEGREPRSDGYYPYRRGELQLTREAAAAFRALREAALAEGYNLRLNDAFRPDAEQARRRQSAVEGGTPDADARVAKAGTSEHRTGRAFDIGAEPHMPDGTPARRRLDFAIENAERFGINHYDGPARERMHFAYNVL